MKIYIKHMICLRCEMVVKRELEKLGLTWKSVELGMAEIWEEISNEQLEILDTNLQKSGLELLSDKKKNLIEAIKNLIEEMIHSSDDRQNVKNSDYISQKLNHDYTYLSTTFSKATGMTIRQYIIEQKIERVKEMLLNDELTLTEIAHQLRYSSVAHLSNQFKNVTGLTPTYFVELKNMRKLIFAKKGEKYLEELDFAKPNT